MTDAEAPPKKAPKLGKYTYEGESIQGERVKGTISAPSANAARNELAVQGLRITKISEKKGLQVELTKEKVPLVDIMHFSRQMATFLRAGVPMVEALDNMRQDAENKRFQLILADVLDRVVGGRSVTESLSMHADIFPSYFMALLGAAEHTGAMDEAFDQLHAYIKRDVELNRAVRKAVTYPLVLLGVAIVVTLVIVLFAIPKFAEFFADFDAKLPLPTRMLMGLSDFVQSTAGMVTGIVLLIAAIAVVVYTRTPGGHRNLHALQLKTPLLNTVITYSSTERFTRVLAALLDAGVPLTDSLPAAIDCSNNLIYKERLTQSMEGVLEGRGFAEPLAQTELFPNAIIQMVRVGERTGELSDQLNNAAGFYEDELSYAVDKLTAAFEPLMMIFIGGIVGFVTLAMVSAMYGIYGQVDI
ncbi:MAG TPA: type II secretion system F family protein [Microthrixaceae bacterium]|nr:type II secretion system F family protein [Microthrixaceae bacterium]